MTASQFILLNNFRYIKCDLYLYIHMHVDMLTLLFVLFYPNRMINCMIEVFLEVYTNILRTALCSAKGREWLGEGLIRLASTHFETGDAY